MARTDVGAPPAGNAAADARRRRVGLASPTLERWRRPDLPANGRPEEMLADGPPSARTSRARVSDGFVGTAITVLAFGVAFGYVEAAVVVYLRAALGLVPGAVMAHDPTTFGTFEAVEIARELATLVMIAAVGTIAGRTALERLAWSAVVFGAWDIAYYAGLRLAIGWPPSLDTWDVLFLVPIPWVGPVWAPLVVSAALVVVGLTAGRRLRSGGQVAVGPWRATGALAGGALVFVSFAVEADPDVSVPWTTWPLFWFGMVLAMVATLSALLVPRPSGPKPGLAHRSDGRPPVGSTEAFRTP